MLNYIFNSEQQKRLHDIVLKHFLSNGIHHAIHDQIDDVTMAGVAHHEDIPFEGIDRYNWLYNAKVIKEFTKELMELEETLKTK